jgi:hypothetical protein
MQEITGPENAKPPFFLVGIFILRRSFNYPRTL